MYKSKKMVGSYFFGGGICCCSGKNENVHNKETIVSNTNLLLHDILAPVSSSINKIPNTGGLLKKRQWFKAN